MKEEIICRCKEITRKEIIEVIIKGAMDVDAVKRATSAGMGLCQGRTCTLLIARLISQEMKVPLSKVKLSTFRAPARPVPISILSLKPNKFPRSH